MSEQANRYVIAYDVVDDKRRSRVAKYLQHHGLRVQFSVFLVDARPSRMMNIAADIEGIIESGVDSVMVCRVGVATTIEPKAFLWLGKEKPTPAAHALVI